MTELVAQKDEYECDSSDEEDVQNTIGNVPMEWYNNEIHVGYDISGRRLLKSASSNKGEIDKFLDNFDNKDKSRIIKHPTTGQDVYITDSDLITIRNLCNSRGFISSLDDDFVSDWFSREKMETPISAHPPHKRSFIPSLSDKSKVSLIVNAIKTGRMAMPRAVDKEQFIDADYNDVMNMDTPDIYSVNYGHLKLKNVPDEYLEWLPHEALPNYQTNYQRLRVILRAPKEAPPGHEQSYRSPPEYMLNDAAKRVLTKRFYDKSCNPCKHIDEKPLFPQIYNNVRSLGFHAQLIIDKEKRLKDLVHAARFVKQTVNSSTEKMLEQNRPDEDIMKPYPNDINQNKIFMHDVILSISVSHCGKYVAATGYKFVQIWSTEPLLLIRCYNITCDDNDRSLRNPSVSWNSQYQLLAVANGNTVKIINPKLVENEELNELLQEWHKQSTNNNDSDEPLAKKMLKDTEWSFSPEVKSARQQRQGCSLIISLEDPVLQMSWHKSGDFLHTICGKGKSTDSSGIIQLHRLSKCASRTPFKGTKHQWLTARFNSTKSVPLIYMAEGNQSQIQVYNFVENKMVKTLQLSGKISVMEMHPSGDHLIVGTVEGKMCWFDLDMGVTPFKTLNLSCTAIRSVTLHSKYPLLSCSTANGSVVIIYARVFTSYDKNTQIFPVEVFQKLDKKGDMYAHCFHPNEPTLYCGGADECIRIINSVH